MPTLSIFAKNNLSKGNLFIQKHCKFTIFKGKKKHDRFLKPVRFQEIRFFPKVGFLKALKFLTII
ncbi:MAG: hypothetical protein DRQ57_19560 [Gammaproteobacteria bacterium]|nr:MAG: hypothetical protein DRQ57_19560 [Gammaproteobacteria bacterium]